MAGVLLVCRQCRQNHQADGAHCLHCGASLRNAIKIHAAGDFRNVEGAAYHQALARKHRSQTLLIGLVVVGLLQSIITLAARGSWACAGAHVILTAIISLVCLRPWGGPFLATLLGAGGTMGIWLVWMGAGMDFQKIGLLMWLVPMTGIYVFLGWSAWNLRDLTA